MGQFTRCKACHNAKPYTTLLLCGDCGNRFCDDEHCGPYESHAFSSNGWRCPRCSSFNSKSYGEIAGEDGDKEYSISESSVEREEKSNKILSSIIVLMSLWLLPFFAFQAAIYFGFPKNSVPIGQQLFPIFNLLFLILHHFSSLMSSLLGEGHLAALLKGDAATVGLGILLIGGVTLISAPKT